MTVSIKKPPKGGRGKGFGRLPALTEQCAASYFTFACVLAVLPEEKEVENQESGKAGQPGAHSWDVESV
jgi:hypothetical protein